jgi:hypothetical protein
MPTEPSPASPARLWKPVDETSVRLMEGERVVASVEHDPADSLFYIAKCDGREMVTNLPFEAMQWAEEAAAEVAAR